MKTEETVENTRNAANYAHTASVEALRDALNGAADRLELLERALEQVVPFIRRVDVLWIQSNPGEGPDLAAWLQEHNASTVPVGDGA